ncbi:alpha-amylase family glycosyl hydrolase [Dyadobacter tibetensis]|uniref:alpha-amylase family glycosyl hydrolase n=1 Tax=Dyadobacter tibetensis TaxID=1211851 RepID=UPI0004706795|nr:alpha-amylase family glycosyl hydrolase [Dyadobacter tibetensis]
MKNYIITIFLCWISSLCLGQALQVSPAFPISNGKVTLTFDLKLAKDSRKEGLLNPSADLYIWAWGGSEANNQSEYGPEGQTSFDKPFAPGKLTALGNDKWSITFIPDQYLSVPTGKKLVWMGVLVKNADGSAQTEDFTFDLYLSGALQVAFTQPQEEHFFVEANTTIDILAKASKVCDLSISVDNIPLTSLTDSIIGAKIPTGRADNRSHLVLVTAKANGEEKHDSFTFTVNPSPSIASLPQGLKKGINYTSDRSATLVLFAPDKNFVHLLGDFNEWMPQSEYLMNRTPDGKTYWLELKNLEPGREYPFQYLVNGVTAVADPYSEKILDRNNDHFIPDRNYPDLLPFPDRAKDNIVTVLQTNQPTYSWQNKAFERPKSEDLVIYELLVRDFAATQWYQTLADTLPYLKRLGINAIELMPIMEFAGNDSWGYNPIFPMAPDKAYGRPQDLKRFIDLCHQNGIAVILDMVLNQADYDFPYVKMYWDGSQPASDSPMFNRQATHPFSVFFDFNHEAPATKELVRDVTRFWLEEYHFDGYRFDLSKGFTQTLSEGNVNAWGQYDASRIAIWKEIYNHIRSVDSTAYVILEHFGSDQEEAELTKHGMLVWDNQNGAFRETIKNGKGNFNRLSWKNHIGFDRPAAIGYMESHDEERLMFDAQTNGGIGNGYSARNLNSALERVKASSALFLLTPGPKMIWQFGELGYDISIDENGRTGAKPIKWEYQKEENRQKLYQVIAQLIALRDRSTPLAFDLDAGVNPQKKLHLTTQDYELWVLANLGLEPADLTLPAGTWFDYFTGQTLPNVDKLTFSPGQFHILTSVALPSPQPNLVPWEVSVVTGNEPKTEAKKMILAPNPVTESALISWSSTYLGYISMKIFDSGGQLLETYQYPKTDIQFKQYLGFDHLTSGIYILQIQEGTHSFSKKWIKQ